MSQMFDLGGKTAVITGGAGFLGRQHADAILSFGGTAVLLDRSRAAMRSALQQLSCRHPERVVGHIVDITDERAVARAAASIARRHGGVHVLINNAANDPKVGPGNALTNASRLEHFPLSAWDDDLAVGLTGAFLCCKHFGPRIVASGGGSIINISSDLGVIAPDQRLYARPGLPRSRQSVKPVTYSVVKTGLVGLTRYLATYWADQGVRCNALCPGGFRNRQPAAFLKRVARLVPMGRMAEPGELQGAIVFLASDASSYMNGSVISIDGGRSCW
ncbi:MAG: SDR family oxidoreductase [Elusimicrobiota bacterium]